MAKQHIFRETTDPTAAPQEVGHHWVNTADKKTFLSVGTDTVDDWLLMSDEDSAAVWGNITGTLADQTDLNTALGGKADSAHTHVKADITDFNDADYATAAQGDLADTAVQPGSLAVVATSGDYDDLLNKPTIPDVSDFETTTQLNARDTANRDRANHTGVQNIGTVDGGGAFNFAGFDSGGVLTGLGGYQYNSFPADGLNFNKQVVPEDTNNFRRFHQILASYNPTVTDAQETWAHFTLEANIGDDNSGNQLGNKTDPGGLIGLSLVANSRRSSNFHEISQLRGNTTLGSDTESAVGRAFTGSQLDLSMQSESSLEFATFYSASISSSNDSEIEQNINGYTMFGQAPDLLSYQFSFTNLSLRDFQYGTAFGDFTNSTGTGESYQSANFSPSLNALTNNMVGLNINPTVDSCQNYQGIVVMTNNVNTFPGAQASLVVQDLTYTALQPGQDANNFQIEYVGGGTAGSEGITLAGSTMTVEIEGGVSTATQIKAAVDASPAITFLSVAVTGTGSNTQTTFSATNFSGGEWPGQKLAAQFNGDVQVNGELQFSGGLNVGQLNAFSFQPAVDGGGQPQSVHSLITGVFVNNNETLTTADTIGVNTACLIQIGENASVSTAFLGIAAMGLPAVVTMLSGSTVDRVSGGVFALSLDAASTGGTIDELSLCRSVALPNGVTTVNNVFGYDYSAPFGSFGFTNTYPFHTTENFSSYFRGGLVVGESSKDRTNSSVLLEVSSTTGAFLNARMTTTERDALTAVDGMQIYNTTDDKLQVRAAGSWVDLH
jgi:hypothetical protein